MAGRKDRAATLVEASLLLAVLFLGTNPVAVKVAVAEFPPLPFVTMRFTLAGLLLLALVALLEPAEGRPTRRDRSGASSSALRSGWRGRHPGVSWASVSPSWVLQSWSTVD